MIDVEAVGREEILGAIRRDRDGLFAELVRRYHTGLVATSTALVGQGEAEEVTQEAWISAYRAIENFEARSSLKTWLTRIVINHARMRLRKRGREINLDVSAHEDDPFNGRFKPDGHWLMPPRRWQAEKPEDLLDEENLLECLRKHLAALPANQRIVIEMRDLQGLDLDEICNILEITSSNVRVLLHRARGRIYNMVEHYQETGEC